MFAFENDIQIRVSPDSFREKLCSCKSKFPGKVQESWNKQGRGVLERIGAVADTCIKEVDVVVCLMRDHGIRQWNLTRLTVYDSLPEKLQNVVSCCHKELKELRDVRSMDLHEELKSYYDDIKDFGDFLNGKIKDIYAKIVPKVNTWVSENIWDRSVKQSRIEIRMLKDGRFLHIFTTVKLIITRDKSLLSQMEKGEAISEKMHFEIKKPRQKLPKNYVRKLSGDEVPMVKDFRSEGDKDKIKWLTAAKEEKLIVHHKVLSNTGKLVDQFKIIPPSSSLDNLNAWLDFFDKVSYGNEKKVGMPTFVKWFNDVDINDLRAIFINGKKNVGHLKAE